MADRSITYDFRANLSNFKAQLAAGSRAAKDFGNDLTGIDAKGEKMRRGLDELGGKAGRVGLALGAAFAAATVKAANFEQSMSFVQAATHESAKNMDLLREAALKAGADTAFSATEAAGAIEELAKAGVSTEQIMGGGLTGALDLAAAGGLDVAEAAEAAASAMTQFKLSGEDVPHIADLLAAGAGKAQGSVHDMSAALNQSGLVAAQTGLTIEETTGALAAFASAGLIGSDAGTSFKTMLQALTPTSEKASKLMDELGISAYDSQGNFVGLAEFAGQLKGALSELSVEQQNAALKTIFGSDAVRAAAVLYEQGAEGIQSWIGQTNDAGYAAETAAIRMDNLKGDLEQLGGAIETLLIGGGSGQTGFLRELTQGATDLINVLNKLPSGAQATVTTMLGLGALTAGGFWFTGKAVSAIGNTRKALADLGLQAPRTATALRALMRTAAVFAALEAGSAAIDHLRSAARGAAPDVQELTTAIIAADSADLKGVLGGSLKDLADAADRGALNDLAVGAGNLVDKTGVLGDTFKIFAPQITHASDEAEKFAQAASSMDAALAGLVASGGPDRAQAAFEALADAEGLSADTRRELMKVLPEYESALSAAANAATLEGEATKAMGDASAGAVVQTEEMTKALEDARKGALDTAGEFVNLGESLNDPKVSLRDWIGELEAQAKALKDFRKSAEDAAYRGLDEGLIQSLQNAGTEGAMRLKQLADASDTEIERANKAWRRGEKQTDKYTESVEDLLRKILGLPPVHTTKITVNSKQAQAAMNAVLTKLGAIKDKNVNITATWKNFYTPKGLGKPQPTVPQPFPDMNPADGGTIPEFGGRPRRADNGSTVPKGGIYADRYPYLLAPGEEVISNRNGQADRWRPFLKAINAGKLADGGTATGIKAHMSSTFVGGLSMDGIVLLDKNAQRAAKAMLVEEKVRKSLLEKELSASKERVDAIRAEAQALRESVKSRLTADSIWGGNPTQLRDLSGLSAEQQVAEIEAWKQVNKNLSDPSIALRNQIAQSNELKKLMSTLAAKGLNGAAFNDLVSNASIEQIAAFAGKSAAELDAFERLYNARDKAVASAQSQAVVNAGLLAENRAQSAHLARLEATSRSMDKRIAALTKEAEKTTKAAAKDGPDRFAKQLNNVATVGKKGRA